MRSIAFLTQKGGTGKTTLAASLAEAAASTGETVIALDLDPQGSLCRWGKRREAAKATNKVIVEPLEPERLPRLKSILEGLADAGFTLAIFDTARAESATIRPVTEAVDLCLLPARPTRFDIEATTATFRAIFLAKRKAASTRASEAAKSLNRLGILAEPMLCARMDFQDAIAAGLGVIEYAHDGRAAQEVATLWSWSRVQIAGNKNGSAADRQISGQAA
jgi:chromosome partitioning protein